MTDLKFLILLLSTCYVSFGQDNTNEPTCTGQGTSPIIINQYGACTGGSTSGTNSTSTDNVDLTPLTSQLAALETRVRDLETAVSQQGRVLQDLDGAAGFDNLPVVRDCTDLARIHGQGVTSGVNTIRPEGNTPFEVFCERIEGELWTVIQFRDTGNTNFTRSWQSYRRGFGRLDGEHWLGLDHIHTITHHGEYQLRIDISDWENSTLAANYAFFAVGEESDMYRITVLQYMSDVSQAGDAFMRDYHDQMKFSTFDRDNDQSADEHCAALHGGGWWFNDCDHSNLNGPYRSYGEHELTGPTDTGVEWDAWRQWYSFKATRMAIRQRFNDTFTN